jgi:hypothetical protein
MHIHKHGYCAGEDQMKRHARKYFVVIIALIILFLQTGARPIIPAQQVANPNPPDKTVKLVFIHHSTGENWLNDDYGNLGKTLDANNYFVSDTNYGWGPDAIGDRTDIPNWLEWFSSSETPRYMDALFNETEQHSSYTRNTPDPGGENEIILFKSCFPNSALAGNPDDPAMEGTDLTVGNAMYVYNQILKYFATRPDKLFIVITQPPLSDPEYAANARAFTNWLASDWLDENNYTLPNVAVFDFHNILTAPDAHHRYIDGRMERLIPARDTLYYPSGDDHPNVQGSQKATEEFIPLLNIFYHRWQANNPQDIFSDDTPVQIPEVPAGPGAITPAEGMIDDFEGSIPDGTLGWQAYHDDATDSKMTCTMDGNAASGGSSSLLIEADVAPSSWATCSLNYAEPRDFTSYDGVQFQYLTTDQNTTLDVDIYSDSPDGVASYVYRLNISDTGGHWKTTTLKWQDFLRVDWEANAGESFDQADKVTGLAFGFGNYEQRLISSIRIHDLILVNNGAMIEEKPVVEATVQENQPPVVNEDEENAPNPITRLLPCSGSILIPVVFILLVYFFKYSITISK